MKLISLLLSMVAIIISIVCKWFIPMAVTDGALTLISICVTLIVGLSVVDSLAVYNMHKRIEKLTEKQKELEAQECRLKEAIAEQAVTSFVSTHVSWGLTFINMQPYTSFRYFVKGLEKALENNYTKGMRNCLNCMEQVPKVIKQNKEIIKDKAKKEGCPQLSDAIKQSDAYKLVEDRIDKIFDDMKSHYQSK